MRKFLMKMDVNPTEDWPVLEIFLKTWTFCLFWAEIERILNGGKVSGSRDEGSHSGKKFCDVTKDKPIKVTVRTYVPTRDHPKVSRR